LAMLLLAVTLGSLLGWRRVLAVGVPVAIVSVLEEVRRSFLRACRVGDVAVRRQPTSSHRQVRDVGSSGILTQLRQALAISPLAPPRPVDRIV
jgi:hypothetical protein